MPKHLDRDLVAGLGDERRIRHARPTHFGDVEQSLHAGAKIDEHAEVPHRDDTTSDDRANTERTPDLLGARLLLFFERAHVSTQRTSVRLPDTR
jgi:hypothetical protein